MIGSEGGGNFKLTDVAILAVGMTPTDEYYISFTSHGVFTLENVMIGMAEPFTSWKPESKAFNSSYLLLKNGEYIIKDVNFIGMVVGKEKTFIHSYISESCQLKFENCKFELCGCIETGYSIHLESSSSSSLSTVSSSTTLLVVNCSFISCIGNDGGIFRFI
jgi:hypothetical protein